MTVDQMIEILRAAQAGKELQHRRKGSAGNWNDYGVPQEPSWLNFRDFDWRIKKEPHIVYINVYKRGGEVTYGGSFPTLDTAEFWGIGDKDYSHTAKFVEVVDN